MPGTFKALFAAIILVVSFNSHADGTKAIDWNDDQLDWLTYQQGIQKLKTDGGAGLLIIYTDWCPVCDAYAKLFKEPTLGKILKDLVLIRVNADHEPEIYEQYTVDGNYIPKTISLDNQGKVIERLHVNEGEDDLPFFVAVEESTELKILAQTLRFYAMEFGQVKSTL